MRTAAHAHPYTHIDHHYNLLSRYSDFKQWPIPTLLNLILHYSDHLLTSGGCMGGPESELKVTLNVWLMWVKRKLWHWVGNLPWSWCSKTLNSPFHCSHYAHYSLWECMTLRGLLKKLSSYSSCLDACRFSRNYTTVFPPPPIFYCQDLWDYFTL